MLFRNLAGYNNIQYLSNLQAKLLYFQVGSKMILKGVFILEEMERPFTSRAVIPLLLIKKATALRRDRPDEYPSQPSINTPDRSPGPSRLP